MSVKIIKLKEPLLIEGGVDESPGLRILPAGTVMYQDDETKDYTVFFNHEGALAQEVLEGISCDEVAPIRLTKITREEILRRSEQFPLTKEDFAAVISAGALTRDDLADILRHSYDALSR